VDRQYPRRPRRPVSAASTARPDKTYVKPLQTLDCGDVLPHPAVILCIPPAVPPSAWGEISLQDFKALRESGLIRGERVGVEMRNTLRCVEMDRRFPGLIKAIVKAHNVQLAGNARASNGGKRKAGRRNARTK
jgi:hypothetical protein